MFTVSPVRLPADLAATAALFQAYALSLGMDLAYQGFEAELQAMPGKYAPPGGELLLARLTDGTPAGCVGLRPLDLPGVCEMKRLFVPPLARGKGIGRVLVDEIIAVARLRGYADMRLDSLSTLTSALVLYQATGFQPIPAYCENPSPDAVFMGLAL